MNVTFTADFTCPFSYIGKRRLDEAIAQSGEHIDVTLQAFQLTPEAPTDKAVPTVELLAKKFNKTYEETLQTTASLREQAASMGLEFNYETMKAPNTKKAHRLTKWAATKGKGYEAVEAFFRAIFTEGKDLNQEEDLLSIVESLQLPTDEAKALLATDRYEADVDADRKNAVQSGIRSVPVFVVDDQYMITGIQPVELFLQTFAKAHS